MDTNRIGKKVCATLVWSIVVLATGCTGPLHHAAREHAMASSSVAMTLLRSTAGLGCEEMKDAARNTCKVSVGIIEDQAKALQESATKLLHAAH